MNHTFHRTPTDAAKPRLQLRIELLGIEPTIWRRILVPETITLARLHSGIQAAMGWTNSHLHEFSIGGERYGTPDPDWILPGDPLPEARVRLVNCLNGHKTFSYLYDFGDGWEHTITVEKRLLDDELLHPLCIEGENACPPEDVGGAAGYINFLGAIGSPMHPEHDLYRSWWGGDFNPVSFDLMGANKKLTRIKL